MMKPYHLVLVEAHMDALRAISKQTGVPLVRLIRRAVAEFLERNKGKQ